LAPALLLTLLGADGARRAGKTDADIGNRTPCASNQTRPGPHLIEPLVALVILGSLIEASRHAGP
jgi:hypothetical protein